MNIQEFEKVVKYLDESKFHVCRMLGFEKEEGLCIVEWSIFRKDMPQEEYYSKENLAVLSSNNGNTLEDIQRLVEECRN